MALLLGTSSPRRKAQLEQMYTNHHVNIKPIRGNIDTRLAKLDAGDYDAIVLAEAGLDALQIKRDYTRLPIVPAIGQGIIALQTRKDDDKDKCYCKQSKSQINIRTSTVRKSITKRNSRRLSY